MLKKEKAKETVYTECTLSPASKENAIYGRNEKKNTFFKKVIASTLVLSPNTMRRERKRHHNLF